MQEVGIIAKIVDDYADLSVAGKSLVDRLVIGTDRYLVTKHSGSVKKQRRGATPPEQPIHQPQRAKRGGRPRKTQAQPTT